MKFLPRLLQENSLQSSKNLYLPRFEKFHLDNCKEISNFRCRCCIWAWTTQEFCTESNNDQYRIQWQCILQIMTKDGETESFPLFLLLFLNNYFVCKFLKKLLKILFLL